jgi:hypothetical protein
MAWRSDPGYKYGHAVFVRQCVRRVFQQVSAGSCNMVNTLIQTQLEVEPGAVCPYWRTLRAYGTPAYTTDQIRKRHGIKRHVQMFIIPKKKLLTCPWISRVWIYQKILLVSNLIIVCGDIQVRWDTLERGLLLLSAMGSVPPLDSGNTLY